MTERRSGAPRLLKSALATTTLPLVVFGSGAMAAPAMADAPRQALTPRSATPVNIETAQVRLFSAQLASSVPASLTGPTITAAKASGTYTVKSGDTLSHIAVRHDLSLSTLLSANGLTASSIIHPGQQIKLSGSAGSSSSPSSSAGSTTGAAASTYTVKSGDTLYGISSRHGVSLSAVLSANGLSSTSTIYPGQQIKLSGSAGSSSSPSSSAGSTTGAAASTYTVKSGDTLYGISSRHGVSLSAVLSANGLSSTSTIYPGQKLRLSGSAGSSSSPSSSAGSTTGAAASTYTVKSGDTLSGIAARNGLGLSTLLKANGLSSTAIIHPGQKLKLSGSAAPAATPAQDDLVPNTFLHYTYPDHIVRDANANKRALLDAGVPSRSQMQAIVADTARSMGVDPSLALAHAFTESSFNHASVSPANAIGTMQVIPSSGEWASDLVGRKLNLLDPHDNAVAGVAIIRQLQRTAGSFDIGVAAYYQGLGGVQRNGMKSDTKAYVAKVKNYMKRF
ncbi:LysM peptidoglycan-binding domain-containing protein [Citricoccus nitrophenolicus]|uniref:LysM peptidoglycan-binding domain-containing protein n=1 Tax=Citricoccus nitrophenolicus TaxID=863575 RepID=A0ABV0IMZ3_9MICC